MILNGKPINIHCCLSLEMGMGGGGGELERKINNFLNINCALLEECAAQEKYFHSLTFGLIDKTST
jgi:hypothetical protein